MGVGLAGKLGELRMTSWFCSENWKHEMTISERGKIAGENMLNLRCLLVSTVENLFKAKYCLTLLTKKISVMMLTKTLPLYLVLSKILTMQ